MRQAHSDVAHGYGSQAPRRRGKTRQTDSLAHLKRTRPDERTCPNGSQRGLQASIANSVFGRSLDAAS